MRHLPSAAAILLAAAPALAQAPAERRVTRDGHTYVYSVRQDGERQVIEGRIYPAGDRFRLVVTGDQVRGHVDRVPVSFRATGVPTATVLQLAAR